MYMHCIYTYIVEGFLRSSVFPNVDKAHCQLVLAVAPLSFLALCIMSIFAVHKVVDTTSIGMLLSNSSIL